MSPQDMTKILDDAFAVAMGTDFDRKVRECAASGLSKAQTARRLSVSAQRISNWSKANPDTEFAIGNKGRSGRTPREIRYRVVRSQLGMTKAEFADYQTLREKGHYSADEAQRIIKAGRKKVRCPSMKDLDRLSQSQIDNAARGVWG